MTESSDLTQLQSDVAAAKATQVSDTNKLAADLQNAQAAQQAALTAEAAVSVDEVQTAADETSGQAIVSADVTQAIADAGGGGGGGGGLTQPFATTAGFLVPDPGWTGYPFVGASVPIPSSPTLASNSATIASHIVSQIAASNGGGLYANQDNWCANRYVVNAVSTAAAVPLVTVNVLGYQGSPTGTFQFPIPVGAIPDSAQSGGSGDHGMIIINVDAQHNGAGMQVCEGWNWSVSGGVYSCFTAGVISAIPGALPLLGPWTNSPSGHGEASSGLSYSWLQFTVMDLYKAANGTPVAHPLAMALQNLLPTGTGVPALPAVENDGNSGAANAVPIGTWWFLNPALNCSVAAMGNVFASAVGTALQQYGCLIVDIGGPAIICENDQSWEAASGGNTPWLTNAWTGGQWPTGVFSNLTPLLTAANIHVLQPTAIVG